MRLRSWGLPREDTRVGFDYRKAQASERGHGDQSLGGMVWGSVLLVGLSVPTLFVAYSLGLTPLQFVFVELGLLGAMIVLYPFAGRLARELHAWIERSEDAVDAQVAQRKQARQGPEDGARRDAD